VWLELSKDVNVQLDQLTRSLADSAPERERLLSMPGEDVPSVWDRRAAASVLHECYNGIENVFKRVATLVDRSVPAGPQWHSDLLLQVTAPGGGARNRPPVITRDLSQRLREYMSFRHVARVVYAHEFDWDRIRPLLNGLPDVIRQFSTEIEVFLNALKPAS